MKRKGLAVLAALMAVIGYGYKNRCAASIGIIGGADGPTAIFVAGKTGMLFYAGIALMLAAFAVLIVCAAAIVFFTPGESLPVPAASNILLEKTAHLPHTTLYVTADESLTLLTCRQETQFTNETAATRPRAASAVS